MSTGATHVVFEPPSGSTGAVAASVVSGSAGVLCFELRCFELYCFELYCFELCCFEALLLQALLLQALALGLHPGCLRALRPSPDSIASSIMSRSISASPSAKAVGSGSPLGSVVYHAVSGTVISAKFDGRSPLRSVSVKKSRSHRSLPRNERGHFQQQVPDIGQKTRLAVFGQCDVRGLLNGSSNTSRTWGEIVVIVPSGASSSITGNSPSGRSTSGLWFGIRSETKTSSPSRKSNSNPRVSPASRPLPIERPRDRAIRHEGARIRCGLIGGDEDWVVRHRRWGNTQQHGNSQKEGG